MEIKIEPSDNAKVVNLAKEVLAALEKEKKAILKDATKRLQKKIKRLVNKANRYTSMGNLLRALFAIEAKPIPYPNYIEPSSEELEKWILEHDGNAKINVTSFMPVDIVLVGQDFIDDYFGLVDHPFAFYAKTSKKIKELLEIFDLTGTVGALVTLDAEQILLLTRTKALLENNSKKRNSKQA